MGISMGLMNPPFLLLLRSCSLASRSSSARLSLGRASALAAPTASSRSAAPAPAAPAPAAPAPAAAAPPCDPPWAFGGCCCCCCCCCSAPPPVASPPAPFFFCCCCADCGAMNSGGITEALRSPRPRRLALALPLLLMLHEEGLLLVQVPRKTAGTKAWPRSMYCGGMIYGGIAGQSEADASAIDACYVPCARPDRACMHAARRIPSNAPCRRGSMPRGGQSGRADAWSASAFSSLLLSPRRRLRRLGCAAGAAGTTVRRDRASNTKQEARMWLPSVSFLRPASLRSCEWNCVKGLVIRSRGRWGRVSREVRGLLEAQCGTRCGRPLDRSTTQRHSIAPWHFFCSSHFPCSLIDGSTTRVGKCRWLGCTRQLQNSQHTRPTPIVIRRHRAWTLSHAGLSSQEAAGAAIRAGP